MVYGVVLVQIEVNNNNTNASFFKNLYIFVLLLRMDLKYPEALRTVRTDEPLKDLNYWFPETETLITAQNVDSEQLEAANFVVAQNEVVSAIPTSMETTSYSTVDDHITVEISRYLAKPIPLRTGAFTGSDVSTTFPADLIPQALLSNAVYANKVRGYAGFRATTVLTLQVNSEKFQQGRYILSAVPCGGMLAGTKLTDSTNAHTASLVQRTMVPRVEIDLATQRAAVLKLPYSSALNYFSLVNVRPEVSTWYSVRIFPYKELEAVAGSLDAKFVLWAHFEDVQLIGQSIPVGLQSGYATKTISKRTDKSDSEKEKSSATLGPVSSVSTKISQAAGVLNVVPFIGSYMTGVSWAADIVTSVAKIFGFSAPSNVGPVTRVRNAVYAYATNVDKYDQSLPLGFSTSAEVEKLPGLSPDIHDEMAIAHFVSRSTWFRSVDWLDSLNYDDLISRFNVGLYPTNTVHSIALPVVQQCPSPMQFMAMHFSKWRGSIWFRLKFVKTEFHTGRIAIIFTPTNNGLVPAALTSGVQPYVYRDIVDITDLTEYEFCVPFISPDQYLTTDVSHSPLYGVIELRVVDPLVHPSTVSPACTILMEYWGGEDMEFAVPHMIPHQYMDEIPVQLQAGLGSMKLHQATLDPATNCIGERIMSLRALSRKFFPVARAFNTAVTPGFTDQQYFLPFCAPHVKFTAENPSSYADFYTDMCAMFCYSRGGIRLKATEAAAAVTPYDLYLRTVDWIDSSVVEGYLAGGGMNAISHSHLGKGFGYVMFGDVATQTCIEVSLPQYGFRQARVNHGASASDAYRFRYYSSNPQLNDNLVVIALPRDDVQASPPGNVDNRFRWYRACADDGDFSTFISIRPMVVTLAI